MGMFVANKVVKLMINNGQTIKGSDVLVMCITFKEDCPDVRKTRVIDIYNELLSFDMEVDVYDPWINQEEVKHEYGIDILTQEPNMNQYSAVILAVAHKKFANLDLDTSSERVVYDVKGVLKKGSADARL